MLPARAANAKALLCPANLAPLAHPRNVIVIHDAAALRHPEWYSPAYAAWQGRILPALARRALHVVTVSEFSRRELTELLGLRDVSVIPGGVDPRYTPDADTTTARRELNLTKPYVLCVASQTARKNLQALTPLAAAHRGRRRRRPPPAVRARGGARRAPPPRRRARAPAPRPVRRSGGVRAPEPLRGLRPAGARGDGVRDARRRLRPHRAAGHRRRSRPPRAAGGRGRRGAGAARTTRRSGSGCATRACDARRSSPGRAPPPRWTRCCQPSSLRAAARYTASDRALTTRSPRSRRSPDQLNALTEPSRDSHVYQ